MKKVLFLGGSTQQLPVLKYARDKGYYSILCDYLDDNPGQYLVDEFYCVSTTDEYVVLDIAKNHDIDGIVAYASDPAAYTAAFVGNELGIPSNPAESVHILTDKQLFREFLGDNNFNVPLAKSYHTYEKALKDLHQFSFPIMVKPTDSSGSKGVSKVLKQNELLDAYKFAMNNSRTKEIIIEEFIEMNHDYMIGGDLFVKDGIVTFHGFLNCHRNYKLNPLIPVGKSYPPIINDSLLNIAKEEIQKLISLLDIRNGALNVEFMFDKNDKLYIIEIGPRNGGNMIPELLQDITKVNLVKATVEFALGNNIDKCIYNTKEKVYYSTYILHSSKNGEISDIQVDNQISSNIYNKVLYKEIGDKVEVFDGANKAIGIIFLKFEREEEMLTKMENMDKYIEIKLI